jgi:hypothetical protein
MLHHTMGDRLVPRYLDISIAYVSSLAVADFCFMAHPLIFVTPDIVSVILYRWAGS